MTVQQLAPVVATVTVRADPDVAFEVFTDAMGSWWPIAEFSLGGERIRAVEVDGRVGGSVDEVWDDGTRKPWAEVLEWDPPHRLVLAWNPTDDPDARVPSTVEVVFAGTADGTLVTLTHSGWETWGEQSRQGYAQGWPIVLGRYAAAADR
jgi:uncharacterized protein YndB with AHSA1/START domain